MKSVLNILLFWTRSIKLKFVFVTIIAVFIPMSVTVYYSYININSILSNNIDNQMHQLEQQIQNDIDSQFNLINDTSKQILSNPIIRETLNSDSSTDDSYTMVMKKALVEKQLNYILSNNYLWSNKFIESISIIIDQSVYYCVSRQAGDINKLLKKYDEIVSEPGESFIYNPLAQGESIYFVRTHRNLETMDIQGKIVIEINKAVIKEYYKKVLGGSSARLFLWYDNKQFLFDTSEKQDDIEASRFLPLIRNTSSLYEVTIDKHVFIMTSKENRANNLSFTLIFPKSIVFLKLSESMSTYLLFFLIFLFLSLLVAVFLSTLTLKPISALIKSINKVKSGNFNAKMPAYKERELNQVSIVFNDMTDEINHLITQVYEKQLLLKEAELESLQTQINPHFLFNVLETISWEARLAKDEKVHTMITCLGQFMRANITMNKKEKITIHEELQYIEFYLYLQKIRYGNKLSIDISMEDESIKDFYLPKLSIQPLIENAIVHGFENKRGAWKLDLSFYKDAERIRIEVTDNGVGFDSEQFELFDQDFVPTRKKGHTSIGLYNSNKRIKLFYGESYGITVSSKINEGTKINVQIPLDRGDNAHV